MKKWTAIFALICLYSTAMAGKSLNIGGGLNLSDNSEEVDVGGIETKVRPGFNVGLGLDFFFDGTFGVSPGISLETRGQKIEGSSNFGGTNVSLDGTAKFLYFQIPLLAKAQFPVGAGFIQVLAGPELGFPLSKEVELKTTEDGQTTTQTQDAELSAFDFGLSVGAGFKYPAGAVGVFLEPSYYLGLSNADDSKDDPLTPEDESGENKHRNFKLKLGIYKDL